MSWQLASFLILGGVLLGGFAWYERSRPPSQVVALVAALAALAIAGRIAFAAFPNVKPTTDIVVFAGYALGGAPGFAVGALAALVSNFWFGQGPWTPWQMAGWGLCGLLGAALALGTRNAGRLALAATCGLAGLLYGTLLNFSVMATYGGDLSWERFWLLEARAIPFDAAHVAGNIAFALLAGPALVRMLTRFRERFEWGRGRLRLSAAAAALLLLAVLAPAQAEASSVSRGADWLAAQQNADGGFGASPDDDSGPEITAWAMLGLAAAGRNPFDVQRGGRSPVDFLRGRLDELKRPGDLARTILALDAAGADPRQFGGQNLVRQLLAKRRADGSYVGWPNSTAFAVIALRTAGVSGGMPKTLAWLRAAQNDDGGWGDTPTTGSTADGTGAVLQALSPKSEAAKRGIGFLTRVQRKGGGFSLGGNGPVNTQSTAWAVQGIIAAGRDPTSFRRGGVSATGYLTGQQQTDGHYRYSGASDQTPVWVTSQVLVAAAGASYPLATPPRRSSAGATANRNAKEAESALPGIASAPPSPSANNASPAFEAAGASPGGGSGAGREGGGGAGGGGTAQPNDPPPAFSPEDLEPKERGIEPATGAEAEAAPRSDEPAGEEESSSAVGAVVLGLLAGALAVGAALGARRGWMRWRYGL